MCNGSGTEIKIKQLGPGMIQQMQMRCSNCGGAGFAPPRGVCRVITGDKCGNVEFLNMPVTVAHGYMIIFKTLVLLCQMIYVPTVMAVAL